jgi:exoribonuclease R
MPRKRPSEPDPGQIDQRVLAAVRQARHAGITSQQLALQLGLKDKGQRYLIYDALERLQDEQKIRSGKKGRYHGTEERDIAEGTIDIIASGAGYVRLDEAGLDDVFVHGRNIGTALHGDRVKIRISGGRGARPRRPGARCPAAA